MTSCAPAKEAVNRSRPTDRKKSVFMGGECSRDPPPYVWPERSNSDALSVPLMNVTGFSLQEIHKQVLPEVVGGGEVGFAAAHLRDFLNEIDERIVGGQHEGIDHDVGALAFVYFFQSFADHERIEAKRVLVDAAVFERERGRLAVGDHDDLAHVLALAKKNALGHAEPFARVGVERANLDARELGERYFLGGIVKEDEVERVPGVLRANEVREGHGHAFGGREAVFAVENHAVRTIEQDHGSAGRLILALVDHEVLVADVDGHLGAVAAHGVEQGFADVEIESVAEFIRAGDAARFDAGGEIACVVPAEAAAAERAEQIAEGFKTEEVDGFVGDFEACFGIALLRTAYGAARGHLIGRRDLRRLLGIDEASLREALDEFVDQVFDLRMVHGIGAVEHLADFFAHRAFREEVALLERAQDRFFEGFERALRIELGDAVELGFEAGLQEEVPQALYQFFEVDGVGRFARVFGELGEFHIEISVSLLPI